MKNSIVKILIVFSAFSIVLVLTVLFIFWTCRIYSFQAQPAPIFTASFTLAFLAAIAIISYFDINKKHDQQ